nr:hypothetical protein [Nitrosomonas nitrosa]
MRPNTTGRPRICARVDAAPKFGLPLGRPSGRLRKLRLDRRYVRRSATGKNPVGLTTLFMLATCIGQRIGATRRSRPVDIAKKRVARPISPIALLSAGASLSPFGVGSSRSSAVVADPERSGLGFIC